MTHSGAPGPLLDFFHVCPIGLISFADDGVIGLANPEALNLMIPALGHARLDNVFDLLSDSWPDLQARCAAHDGATRLAHNHRIEFAQPQGRVHLSFTLVRVDDNSNMLVVNDVSAEVEAEEQLAILLERERRTRERTELLERSATHLAAATTVEQLAESVLNDLKKALDTDIASVNVKYGDTIRILASQATRDGAASLGPGMLDRYERADIGYDLPGPAAMRRNETIRLNTTDEVLEHFPVIAAALPEHIVESLTAIPLRSAEGAVLGALVVASREPHWLDDDTISLLHGIVDQAGLALERAQLYDEVLAAREQEHTIALRLQRSLLPDDIVTHPRLKLAAHYAAADDLLTVGGDWYDTFAWPSGEVGVMVGDVAGHDLEATVTMGKLRSAVAALAPVAGPNPAALLDMLERSAAGSAGTAFVTCACVVLDPATGTVRYATAGHPAPIVLHADGSTSWLTGAASPLIGPTVVQQRVEASVVLAPGSTVLLYSDGLVERRGEALDVGFERLANALAGRAETDPTQLVDDLTTMMTRDNPAADDIVVVAVQLLARAADDRIEGR